MTRYIDADALKELKFPNGESEYATGWNDAISAIMTFQPTIDAVPIKHGKWTHDGGYFKNRWICSECGYKWFSTKEIGKFCANCGARMDKDE